MLLTLAAAQYPITFHHHFSAWQQHVAQWVHKAVAQGSQLLLFPEYGAMELVGFFPEDIKKDVRAQVQAIDSLRGAFCEVYEALARQHKVTIVAPSLPVQENGAVYNRTFVFSPRGLCGYQDKFFMTRFENEEWGIQTAPKRLSLFEADWGSFGVQICYDVEFPLGASILCAAGASLVLAPSCTETIRGATRVHIGARARALENQCYVAVSQTVGNALWSPAVDVNYGFAAVYTTPDKNMPEEGIVASETPQKEGWLVQAIDFSKIKEVRSEGQVFNFKDQQQLLSGLASEKVEIVRCKV